MSLTHNQIVKLLAYLAAHDQRTVGEEDVAAWTDAAEFGRWTLDEATAAVRHLINTTSTHRVRPVDVTERIRTARQDTAMRQTVNDRAAAREAIAGATAQALERGTASTPAQQRLGTHLGTAAVDAIYDQHQWSPTARAAVAHRCPWCREDIGHGCSRPSGRTDTGRAAISDPHDSRVALTVACPVRDCAAEFGDQCELDHPHHDRVLLAIGDAGARRRKARAAELRAASVDADWTREVDFTSPDPEHEPPPDPHELPAPRDAHDTRATAELEAGA